MEKVDKEKSLSIIMLIFGLIFLAMILSIPSTESQLFDSRFVPLLMSIFMIAIGIFRFIKFKDAKAYTATKVDYKTVFITLGLLVFYIFTYAKLGFVVTSAVFLFFEITNLKPPYLKSRYLLLLIFSILVPVLIYHLFYFGFKIVLPAGILNGFL